MPHKTIRISSLLVFFMVVSCQGNRNSSALPPTAAIPSHTPQPLALVPTYTPTVEASATPSPQDQKHVDPASNVFTPTPTITSTPSPLVRVDANLRGGPGTNYPIVGGTRSGETIDPIAQTSDQQWLLLATGAWLFAPLADHVPPKLPITSNIPATPIPTPTLIVASEAPVPTPDYASAPSASMPIDTQSAACRRTRLTFFICSLYNLESFTTKEVNELWKLEPALHVLLSSYNQELGWPHIFATLIVVKDVCLEEDRFVSALDILIATDAVIQTTPHWTEGEILRQILYLLECWQRP